MAIVNTGYQGVKVLESFFFDDNSASGLKKPNVENISNEAIVPASATITFNADVDVAPAGGVDGDVWYNLPSDQLYRNYGGVWTLLTEKVINTDYIAPVKNLTDCPL